jgi:hypothetical protein
MSPKSLSILALVTASITMAMLVWAERSRPYLVSGDGAPALNIPQQTGPGVDGELADLRLRIASLNVSMAELADELIRMRRDRADGAP